MKLKISAKPSRWPYNSVLTTRIGRHWLLEEDDKNELPKPVKPLDPVKELFMKHATEDGHIYAKELKHFLRELSASEFGESILFSLEAARSLVTLMDRNRSGALNFDEVVKGWNEIKAYKKIFEQFDKDGTASVDTYELSKLFSALGFTVNRQVQIAIVRRYGNRNNKIRLTDFLIVIFKLTLMFELFKEQQLKTGGNNDAASFTLNETGVAQRKHFTRFPKGYWHPIMNLPRGLVRQEDYLGLKIELLRNNKIFVDPDFSPSSSSLTFSGSQPQISGVRSVIWKRPRELVDNPRFVKDGLSRHDLDQGCLGNCWFIAGAAVVSTIPKLLSRCVPIDQDFDKDYAGLFRFNFYWYGKWVEVIVDDLLPTDGRQLIYARNRSDPDEFWPALLEKAYAKLRGNYEALDGGHTQDAIVDMTGSISETIDLKDKSKIPDNLYELVWKSYQMNSLMGAGINLPGNTSTPEFEMSNGLVMGHAYSITGITSVPYKGNNIQLLRLRNPWGKSEWKGDYSDEIRKISQDERKRLGIDIKDDGEFWISFIDVLRIFDDIQLCHLQPDALTSEIANDERKQSWEVTVYHDAWIRGLTAGGCGKAPYEDLFWKNPQFFITLKDVDIKDNSGLCTLIATLTEKEMNNKSSVAIGFKVYKLREFQRRPLDGESALRNNLILQKRSGYEYNREVTRRFELDPGVYALIPSTYEAHVEAKFMLRLYTEKPAESGLLEEVDKNEL
ncbi:Hypothetical predicted protein, partial [Mytilus galloprovincialis]